MRGSVSMVALRELLLGAHLLGVRGLRADLGIDDAAMADRDARVPFDLFDRAWRAASGRSGQPHFGFRMAAVARLGTNDILDYIANASSTFGDVIDRIHRYYRLMIDAFELWAERTPQRARLVVGAPPDCGVCPDMLEGLVALSFLRSVQLIGAYTPIAVQFSHPPPPDRSEHARVFGCPVLFDQPVCALEVDASLLDHPVRTADPLLCAILDRQATDGLAKVPCDPSFAARTAAAIRSELCGGDPSFAAIARRLRIAPRTLQRRLAAEHTSHEQLLEATRREQAMRYLANRDKGLCEIAFLLGFSEPSAFYRAFRRWTGKTPLDVRRALTA